MGLSAVVATQQPSALDQRVLSQVETFVAHQLVTEADIRAVRENFEVRVARRHPVWASESRLWCLVAESSAWRVHRLGR